MTQLLPHGICFLWQPEILWLHVIADIFIAAAYFSIPLVLAVFAIRRPDPTFRPVLYLFTAFIVLCGITHLFSILVIWQPYYLLEGMAKLATGAVSMATAIVLWPLLPRALAMPTRGELEDKNRELQEEIERRIEAERELKALTQSLELRVNERTEALRQSNEILRQFSVIASHDLQAPLRHIGLLTEQLEDELADVLTDTSRRHLRRIEYSAQRLRRLTQALLEFAQLANTLPTTGSVDSETVVREALADLEPVLDNANATVTCDPLPAVRGQADLLVRVFQNLIDNALKYRSGQPLRIHIEARRDDDIVTFSVSDNGIGIEARYAERVFAMLQRLHAADEYPGSGIGLSVCRRIVESHGGRIWLDTTYSGGARFIFTLPPAEPAS